MSARAAGPDPLPLRIQSVVKRFDGAAALNGLTLSLGRGESLGIAGPNGSGKTTLIDVVSGFVRPDCGSTWFAGHEITRWAPYRIVHAGMARTFQHPTLAGRLTVQQHLEAATLHRRLGPHKRRRAVNDVLDALSLGDLRARETGTLSAGEVRRADLGRALASGAHLLLLDEPLASSSDRDAAEMLSALRRLRSEARTMLIVARSALLLQTLCDRVVSMADGRLVGNGPPAGGRDARDA
jgi:ABC-type branched-subunit amino acid transport system ATPase component